MTLPLLTLLVVLPLAGGVAVLLVGRDRHRLARQLALAASLVTFGLSLILWRQFDQASAAYQFVEHRTWLPDFGISYHVGVDGISLFLVILTTFLTPVALLCSWESIEDRVREFCFFMLALEAAMIGVFVSIDLFLFYLFWDAMLIPMYFLIGIWGYDRRIYAAIKFMLYTMAGSVLMLVAIIWLAYHHESAAGALSFDLIELLKVNVPAALQTWLFLAFAVAFAIKVPLFPFPTWLPDAHVEAPTAGSVILAGVLLKLGGYGFLRFALPLFPDASQTFAPLIVVLSLIAIVYGAIVSIVQPDLKKLVAYSSVSHMGFVTLGIFVFQQQAMDGAVLQMVNHGLITGALFLCVGVIYERTHDRTIARMGGLAGRTPAYAAIFGFFMLASVGLPGLAGFVGEFLVFVGTFAVSPLAAAIAALVMVLGAVYLLWMFQRVAFGPLSEFLRTVGHHLSDLSAIEIVTLAPLAALTLIFGLFPGLLLDLIQGPVDTIIAGIATSDPVAFLPWR